MEHSCHTTGTKSDLPPSSEHYTVLSQANPSLSAVSALVRPHVSNPIDMSPVTSWLSPVGAHGRYGGIKQGLGHHPKQ